MDTSGFWARRLTKKEEGKKDQLDPPEQTM
jgi:hypothetical protein